MKPAKYLIFSILILSFSIAHADIDSKLRVRENDSTISIAGSTNLADSKLHMKTSTGIISVLYVLPTDSWATKTIIKLADGTKMALKKFFTAMNFPNKSGTRSRYCSMTNPYYSEKAVFSIANTSTLDANFVFASSTGPGVSSDFTIPALSTSTINMSVSNINAPYSSCSADTNAGKVVPSAKAYYYVYQNGIQTDYVIFTMAGYPSL